MDFSKKKIINHNKCQKSRKTSHILPIEIKVQNVFLKYDFEMSMRIAYRAEVNSLSFISTTLLEIVRAVNFRDVSTLTFIIINGDKCV